MRPLKLERAPPPPCTCVVRAVLKPLLLMEDASVTEFSSVACSLTATPAIPAAPVLRTPIADILLTRPVIVVGQVLENR